MSMLFHLTTLTLPLLMLFAKGLQWLAAGVFFLVCAWAAFYFRGAHMGGPKRERWLRFSVVWGMLVSAIWSYPLALLVFGLPEIGVACFVAYSACLIVLQWKGHRELSRQ